MATEFSFTKRAAAELSRCFNVGLNVSNKNSASSSSTKKATTTAASTANGIAASNNQSALTNQTTGNESPAKATDSIRNNLVDSSKQAGELSTGRCANNAINNTSASSNSSNSFSSSGNSLAHNSTTTASNDSSSNKANNQTSSSAASNLFTLTNSVKSIGSAYEQNILAAKSALRSPFKSPNKSASTKSIVSNVVSSFNGFDNSANSADPNNRPPSSSVFSASPQTPRKQAPKAPPKTNRARLRNYLLSLNHQKPRSVDELWKDEKFLKLLFQHFSPIDRCRLAQVNSQWRELLYEDKDCWKQLIVTIYFNELKKDYENDADQKLYDSLERRQFRELCIYAANDNDIMEFTTNNLQFLNRLEAVSFKNCNLTDKGLEFLLATVNQLVKLEISSCNDITDSGLWTGLVPNLRSLTLMDCINVADETLATIAMLPTLKEFTLQAYHVSDTGFSFFGIPDNGKASKIQIETLNLISCWELTNQTIVAIAQSMPKLKQLSLYGCSKISDDAVEIISEQLINLTALDLSWCSHITSASLEYLACDLADQLNSLILDRCIHITDQGLNYIASMTSLETLSLRWCPQLHDMGIQTICNMKNLKYLSLAGCSLVTANGITCLVRLPQLQELELTNCPNVTDELITYLKHHLPAKCEIIYN